jgi:flagellar protein FliS
MGPAARAPAERPLTPGAAEAAALHAIPSLYAQLLRHLRETGRRIRTGDPQGTAHHVERATRILYELVARLDPERGGELALRLEALYTYFAGELAGMVRAPDLELLGRITGMVEELHTAWDRISRAPPVPEHPGDRSSFRPAAPKI